MTPLFMSAFCESVRHLPHLSTNKPLDPPRLTRIDANNCFRLLRARSEIRADLSLAPQ
jgi:hypothetical protein